MAAAAPSPLASSVEKTNGAKLSRLLIDGGTTVLRKIFDGHHPPANLITDLNANYPILNNLLRRRVLNGHQWDKLFPPGGVAPDSKTFDITLLFVLLTNICGLTPPPSGWHTEPLPSDTSRQANLARVKLYRNVLYGHVTTTGFDKPTFCAQWTKISGVLVSLGLDQAEVDRLKAEKGGEQDYIDVLIKWAVSEEDIKSQLKALKNIEQSQTQSQQAIEEIAVGLQEVRQAVEDLRHQRDEEKDAVLQKLARSEFRGDIDYYVQRFQADTREWVFDRVQNWLDDTNSQNRVMVISGNAGMGKSVIASVICKRMQGASRLSGSHFCQYNNVRYRKPQLMIQSLACHLSHALPKYREALVKQLTRNQGADDLNSMNVEELFALLFKEPLGLVSDPGRNMLMVIDGLDESEYQGRNELLDVIANQFCKLPSWIRFLVTTRPATNIAEKLKHLKPFELQSNDERNLEDIRTYLERKVGYLFKPEDKDELVEKLVLKCEGLMLYAHFLVLFLTENKSVLSQEELDDNLPLGISEVYHSYFKRLENELMRELDMKEETFLNLLAAITASREPLPIAFVSRILVPRTNSTLAKRKVRRALGSVSALLPIRDDCLHAIHKSVKDWLTDTSCYGEHEFTMDENDGHRILADLCSEELDKLKEKGLENVNFSPTDCYALYHGARHMLHLGVDIKPRTLDDLIATYLTDLQLVYAKTCLHSTTAAEDLLWLQKRKITMVLSQERRFILDTLLFLLRKYLHRFPFRLHIFLQTMLNQGGNVLSCQAMSLFQNKYPKIPYMEDVHKTTQRSGVVARFLCSSLVVCLDVSPQLDYMVCECSDGMLQLWSLQTGRLVWIRPAKVKKNLVMFMFPAYRKLSSSNVLSLYRSVVFHPTKELVLPGILSDAYTIDGELKTLFPKSECCFTVCSVSRDKTALLTNCLDNTKRLVLWSLENGSEISRSTSDQDILSFALSHDERLLAVSHSTGMICLVDAMDGFKFLARTSTPEICGMLKFLPDRRFLFCWHWTNKIEDNRTTQDLRSYCLRVSGETYQTFGLDVSSDEVSYDHREFGSCSDRGFSLGDLVFSDEASSFNFVLNEESLLRCEWREIEMVNTNNLTPNNQGKVTGIAFSSDGKFVYDMSDTSVISWSMTSGKLEEKNNFGSERPFCLVAVRGGVLITKGGGTIELWDGHLSECVKRWNNLPGIKHVTPLSDDRVAFVRECGVEVLDTGRGEMVSIVPLLHGITRVITCNSRCQLLTSSASNSLQLVDNMAVVWKKEYSPVSYVSVRGAVFSPTEKFLVLWTNEPTYVLDAVSGRTCCTLPIMGLEIPVDGCKFVSDEECVIAVDLPCSVQLFNVKSGALLSVTDVEGKVACLTARPQLFAIGLENSSPNFKVFKVHLPHN